MVHLPRWLSFGSLFLHADSIATVAGGDQNLTPRIKIRDHDNEIDERNTPFLFSSMVLPDWVEFIIIWFLWWCLRGKKLYNSRCRPCWFIYALAVYLFPGNPPEWIKSDERRFCTLSLMPACPFKWLDPTVSHEINYLSESHHNMCKYVK
jgi:hypothetical protein